MFSSYPVTGRAPRFLLTSSNSYHSDRISPTIPAKTLKNIPEITTLLKILFPRAASQPFQSLLWVFNAINANQLPQNTKWLTHHLLVYLLILYSNLFLLIYQFSSLYFLCFFFLPLNFLSLNSSVYAL